LRQQVRVTGNRLSSSLTIAVIAMGTSLHPIVCRQDRAARTSGHTRLL
jgi:hypothetical protein